MKTKVKILSLATEVLAELAELAERYKENVP